MAVLRVIKNERPSWPPNRVQNNVKENFTNEPVLYIRRQSPLQPVSSAKQAQPISVQEASHEGEAGKGLGGGVKQKSSSET